MVRTRGFVMDVQEPCAINNSEVYLNDLAYCTRMLGIKMNDLLW